MAAIVKPNQKAIDALPRPSVGQNPVEYRIEGYHCFRLWLGVTGESYGFRSTNRNRRTCRIVCRNIGVKQALPNVHKALRDARLGKNLDTTPLFVDETDQSFVVPDIKAHLKDVKGALSNLRVLHDLKLPNGQRLGDTDYRHHDKSTAKAVLLAAREDRSPARANRLFRRYTRNISILVEADILEVSHCKGVKTLPERNTRTRTLSDAELQLHCQLALETGSPQGMAQLLSVAVGTRIGETVSLRWDMISPNRMSLIIPDPKNNHPIRIQLNSVAKAVLDRCHPFLMNEWIFPSLRNEGEHIARPRESFEQIRSKVFDRLYGDDKARRPKPYWQHDFRRTFASKFCSLTGDLRLTQIALNHKSSSTTEIYTHYLPSQMADASERTAQALFGDLFTTTNP